MFLRALFLFLLLQFGRSIDTLTPSHPLVDGEVLTSKGGKFTLGFFSPGNSSKRYIGIWFAKVSVQTVVWVANRDKPINESSGVLSFYSDGNLRLSSQEIVVWSTNMSLLVSPNDINSTSCQLLDTGNLVLASNNGKTVAWQSFDYPTHIELPHMKLGLDKRTGLNRYLTSWRSTDDPSPGNYSFRFDPNGSPQLFIYNGSHPVWRTGPWVGRTWSEIPEMARNYFIHHSFVNNPNEISISYYIRNDAFFSFNVLDGSSGTFQNHIWQENGQRWVRVWLAPKDPCDHYGQCGDYGSCSENSANQSECNCFPGYRPKLPHAWSLWSGSQGCVREENTSMCRNGEGFLRLASVRVPDTSRAVVNTSMTSKECEEECLRNCSCLAYTSSDDSGNGCMTLYEHLFDTRIYTNGGQDVYFRASAVEIAKYLKSNGPLASKWLKAVLIVFPVLTFAILVISARFWMHNKKRKDLEELNERTLWTKDSEETDGGPDLPFFSCSEIAAATDNFSSANKLGEGGFGSVYKGRLHNGKEIAVKRLAQNSSGQGIREFKNEVKLIAKLQHRNLVKMLGCCVQGEERMLIYEYVPNKSLDAYIFKEEKQSSLDWRTRLDIILGIARGILYLHQDSRLRIIHRDLKASNVLLDTDMVPKISDFGTARILGGNQVEERTTRVVGTYGYMAPEYALEGLVSIKSDVFSFGVLLLEIITGRKNSGHYHDNPSLNLIGHVWDLWRDGKALKIVEPSLNDPYIEKELLRSIQIGLLCVQECADNRPAMSSVVFMLSNKMELIPSPEQPAFILNGTRRDAHPCSSSSEAYSVNEISVTSTMGAGR